MIVQDPLTFMLWRMVEKQMTKIYIRLINYIHHIGASYARHKIQVA